MKPFSFKKLGGWKDEFKKELGEQARINIENLATPTELVKVRMGKWLGRKTMNPFERAYSINLDKLQLEYHDPKAWTKTRSIYDLRRLKEVRIGYSTPVARKLEQECLGGEKKVKADRIISLVFNESHGDNFRYRKYILDLVCKDKAQRDSYQKAFNDIMTYKKYKLAAAYDENLKNLFKNADKNKNGQIDKNEFKELLKKVNPQLERSDQVDEYFDRFNVDDRPGSHNCLDQTEFIQFCKEFMKSPEIEPIFLKNAKDSRKGMTSEELRTFLKDTQNVEDITLENCKKIIEQEMATNPKEKSLSKSISMSSVTGKKDRLSCEGFVNIVNTSKYFKIENENLATTVYQVWILFL